MAGVTFDHVVKKFGDFTAINDLTFRSTTRNSCLVGPSGCEKPPPCAVWQDLKEVTRGIS